MLKRERKKIYYERKQLYFKFRQLKRSSVSGECQQEINLNIFLTELQHRYENDVLILENAAKWRLKSQNGYIKPQQREGWTKRVKLNLDKEMHEATWQSSNLFLKVSASSFILDYTEFVQLTVGCASLKRSFVTSAFYSKVRLATRTYMQ